MNETDIENGLKARLGNNLTDLPSSVAWPNLDHDGARPYLEVIFAGGFRTGGALAGANQILRSRGVMTVNVHADKNGATNTANGYGEAVAALFPEGQAISITGGTVVVQTPSDVRKGFEGDAGWVVPVVIEYVATAT